MAAMEALVPDTPATLAASDAGLEQPGEGGPRSASDPAREAGAGDAAPALIAAWCTGAVAGASGAQAVADREAPIYEPMTDGLPAPTRREGGPGWWAVATPAGGVASRSEAAR